MTDHAHEGFEIDPGSAPPFAGHQVDTVLLGQYLGATYDECPSCQDALLTLLSTDIATTAQLVELACVAVTGTLSGLPVDLVDTTATDSPVPIGFRRLARCRVDGDLVAMFDTCAELSSTQRRAAGQTAANLFISDVRAAEIEVRSVGTD